MAFGLWSNGAASQSALPSESQKDELMTVVPVPASTYCREG